METLTATLQEGESEVKRLKEKNTELWKGVELHRKNMLCVQPMVSKLSATVGELELERHRLAMALAEQEREVERSKKEKELSASVELERDRLTMALTEVEKKKQELSTTVGELELERDRLTMALTEQEREVVRLKKEKKELQEAMEARQSRIQLSPEVAKLSDTLSQWDSSLQELVCSVNVS